MKEPEGPWRLVTLYSQALWKSYTKMKRYSYRDPLLFCV
jgi:hypothetical protein